MDKEELWQERQKYRDWAKQNGIDEQMFSDLSGFLSPQARGGWIVWQALRAEIAALNAGGIMEGMKRYGWVVADRDGDILFDPFHDKEAAEEEAKKCNKHGHFKPYRVYELFYKEDQS